jgi:signal transduction histidine kinase
VIPLRSKDETLGTLEVVRCDARPFTSEEIELLYSIGNQIGMAIHNAQLWQQTRRRLRESMVLLETGRALASVLELEDLLQLIAKSALETIECAESSVIHLLDDASGGLHPNALAGSPASGFGGDGGERLSIGKGIAGCALERGKVINVPDVSSDPRFIELGDDGGFQSLLVAPLVADGKEIGTISVNGGQCGVFTPEDERLVMTLAAHAAIAVKNAQLFAQAEELAVAEERNRIAGELHDRLAQNLASLLMKVDFGLSLIDSDPEATKEVLIKAKWLAGESIEEIRRSIFTLRRQELEEEGFVPGLREYLQAFEEQNELPVHLSIAGEEAQYRLSAAQEFALFRIVQEALTNAAKHARAEQVSVAVDLSAAEDIYLTVRDDGVGFDEEQERVGLGWIDGFGLEGMRRRAEAVGGKLDVKSRPGWGTEISACCPWEGKGR